MRKERLLQIFSFIFPYALILFYIVCLLLSILAHKMNYVLSGSILALPVIAGAILLINMKKLKINSFILNPADFFSIPQKYLLLAFCIFFVLSIISGFLVDSLLVLYPILIICAVLTIFIQITSKNYIPELILTEIVFILLNLIYSTVFRVPLYFGFTDLFLHMHYSHVTVVSGHVIPMDLDSGYSKFPLYHIWVAVVSIISGLNVESAIFLGTCPVFIIGALFIYFIARTLSQNQRLSLFVCLAYALTPIVIFSGKYMITRTLAYVGLIVLLYAVYSLKGKKNRYGFNVLLVLFSIYIVLVHHASIFQILLLLFVLFFCEYFIVKERTISLFLLAFLSVFSLSYWIYSAFDYLKMLVYSRTASQFIEGLIVIPDSPVYSPDIFFLNNIELVIFLFFVIIGVGYIFYSQKPAYLSVIAFFSLLAIFVYIPNPLLSVWQFTDLLRFDRFKLLISPFLALIMGCGMYVTLQYLVQKETAPKYAIIIILALFSVYCCGSLGIVQSYPDTSARESFNFDEFQGLNTIQRYVNFNSTIYSDYYIRRFFQKPEFRLAQTYDLPYYNSKTISDTESLPNETGYFIIAKKQFLHNGLRFSRGDPLNPEGSLYTFTPSEENVADLDMELGKKDKVYSNDALEMYYS